MPLLRCLLVSLAALTCSLALATSAHAGLLVKTVGPCENRPTARVFLPWLDLGWYTPVAGGSFESGTAGWTLSGAKVVSGNESFNVAGAGHTRSLSLPSGSSATTPSTCVGLTEPVLRLFARNTGSLLSTLKVSVRFEDAGGTIRELPVGVVIGTAQWKPTLPFPVLANLLALLPGQGTPVAFRFTPVGIGGKWQIDDVYVDPRRSR